MIARNSCIVSSSGSGTSSQFDARGTTSGKTKRRHLFRSGTLCVIFLLVAETLLAGTKFVKMLEKECWWGLANAFGTNMPFTAKSYIDLDLRVDCWENQTASILLSNLGREIWCDAETDVFISNGVIRIRSDEAPIEIVRAGETLRDAFLYASHAHFPPSGKIPDPLFFTAPQYNTWVELTYHQNEKDILFYAKSILDHGFPPGVLMIDDTWQFDYGMWEFDSRRFFNPKNMVEKLHGMGFKVVLWICPWVSMDSSAFRVLARGVRHDTIHRSKDCGGFLVDVERDAPAASCWWNGYSALLDFTSPVAVDWFSAQCERLMRDYGVDGFKFDGGNPSYYSHGYGTYVRGVGSCEQARLYAEFAERYPVNEYRCAWKMAGKPIVMRLYDKGHRWDELERLIPDLIAGGLLGHQFMCPDMIGGGSWRAFLPDAPVDQELIVRSAQVHALCGMMQFSVNPWRVLDGRHQEAVRASVTTRQKFAGRFLELARKCATSGEPMIRHLAFQYPGLGYETISDEFMLGDWLLVAPQVRKGATERTVLVPPGTWRADDGAVLVGPTKTIMSTPLERLVYLEKIQ